MFQEHPIFHEPDDNQIIWRYMDIAKLISLLDRNELFFVRSDKLEDRFEGIVSKPSIDTMKESFETYIENSKIENHAGFDKIRETFINSSKLFKRTIFINSWHMNNTESIAMWKLYAELNKGVALKTTFERLRNCFNKCNDNVYIGTVRYIDYNIEIQDFRNVFSPFLTKRKSFEHEKELRAIIQRLRITKSGKINLRHIPNEMGIYVKVDINKLIESIYIAPQSQVWFKDVVSSIIKKYTLNIEVFHSKLDEIPY